MKKLLPATGVLVSIEGIDGCGKGTQVEAVADWLGATTIKFPYYDSTTGKAVLELFGAGDKLSPETFAVAMQAVQNSNRLEMLGMLNSALSRGPVVLDRYMVSGFTYGRADGLSDEMLTLLLPAELPLATINILLDISVTESFARRPERQDAYESNVARLENARENYLNVFENPPEVLTGRNVSWHVVDGSKPKPVVFNQIIQAIKSAPVYELWSSFPWRE